MSQHAKSVQNIDNYLGRVAESIASRKHRIYDDRFNAMLEAMKLIEQQSDDYYPAILSYDSVLSGLAPAVLTDLVLTGTNLVGAAEKATGETAGSTGQLDLEAVLPGDQEITVTITIGAGATAVVSAVASTGLITVNSQNGTGTAAQLRDAINAHATAKFMVQATEGAAGAIDAAEVVTVECSTVDPGTLPVLQIGSTAIDGSAAGFGITAYTDTSITFDCDASLFTPGATMLLRLWVDDVLVFAVPLIVDLGGITPDEISIGIRNETGAPIVAGSLVYLSGWSEAEERWLIALADSDNVNTAATFFMRTTLADVTNGVAYRTGDITGADTSTYVSGDPIYLSTVAGGWVQVLPLAGGVRAQVVGRVGVVDAVVGTIHIDLVSNAPFQYLSNLDLQNGILSADANGRALMATNYFDNATLLLKFADGAFAASADTRALFADDIWTPAKLNARDFFVKEHDFELAAGVALPAPLGKNEHNAATGDYVNDAAGGEYVLTTTVAGGAEAAQVTWDDQLMINPTKTPIFEARVKINFAGAALIADERGVFGLCSAHPNAEDSLDNVASNIWFRVEGVSLNIFIEGDDGATDTDDVDSTIPFADDTYIVLKIDMTDLSAVRFFIDGVEVGTTINVVALTGANLLQPIFCFQRDGAASPVEVVTVDWYRVYAAR